MATTPQGNFAAYKELKYRKEDRDQTVDFISLGIDRLITEGKARDAAKLKQAQDLGKTYYDAVKDIKIEPTQTVAMFQDFYNKAFNETFDDVAEAKRITQDPNVPNSVKQQYSQRALQKQKGYMELKTFLGDKDQIKLFTDKLGTDTSKIWRGDEGLKIMRAVKANAITIGYNQQGRAIIKFLDPDSNEVVEKDFSTATQAVINPYTEELVNKTGGLYDQMRQEATNMLIEKENGEGGNRTTKSLGFNPEDAKKSFDIRFGDYNLNNDDAYLTQFSYDVLNNRTIKSKEDWDKVKQAYVDKMGTFVKSESSTVDKYTAAQIEGQGLSNKKTKAQIRKLNEVKTEELVSPAVQPSVIRLYNSEGKYIGRTETPTATVNIPGTQNFLSAKPYVSKDGKTVYNKYFVGGFAPDGTIIHNEVKDPVSVLSASKSKDKIKVMADLNRSAGSITPVSNDNPINIITDRKDKMYQQTSINLKAKVSTENAKRDFENSIYEQMVNE